MTLCPQEEDRLYALRQLNLLDTPPAESFDRITRMATRLFDLPIAAISLTDRDRQWFKSRVGVDHWEIPRERAPCGEVADTAGYLVVPDLLADECYRHSLLAQSGIRFYAGAPLVTRDGFGLGAMCVLGTEPRQVTEEERKVLADLAAMVMAQIELQHALGRVDATSGLPNRHQLLDDLLDEARDEPGGLRSLVIAEVIEPTRSSQALRVLGPTAIDDLVRSSTRLLAEVLGPQVKVYHVGHTQFAWRLTHQDEAHRDRGIAKVRGLIEAYLGANVLPTLASPVIGIAPFRLGQTSPEDAIRTAYSAAQDARANDTNVGVYSERADQDHRRRFRLLADMRAALTAGDQLRLVYQPRIDLRSGDCLGAEALLRWQHPALGAVSPGEFIPIVEQTEVARSVTEWVVAEACRQAREWRARGIALAVSVNVSPANLEEAGFAARFLARIEEAGLPPEALEVEVTESALIRDGGRVGEQLRLLRGSGVRVAIDDFGTGYSSLAYIGSLPADVIKIDQSFIRDLSGNPRRQTLVRAIVEMARSLDFAVVAEGVEDAASYAFLGETGCDQAQGYLISRPVPAAAFETWLAGWPGAPPAH